MTTAINEIVLAQGTVPEWVMLARTGRWLGHPAAAQVITPDNLRSAHAAWVRNFAANGTDVVVDYHHSSVAAMRGGTRAPAAGWIDELQLRAGGEELWGHVAWTPDAANAIGAREYRYVSPVLAFGAPDPVSGRAEPLQLHSVALTNTPFMRELKALNHDAGTDAGHTPPPDGGSRMELLKLIAVALGVEPAVAASKLGVNADAADAALASGLTANAAELAELKAAVHPPVSKTVANALGVADTAGETAALAAVLKLKAPGAGLAAVRSKLALAVDADEATICNSISDLQAGLHANAAEAAVDAAVAAGKLAPAHREHWLGVANANLDAAKLALNDMPVIIAPPTGKVPGPAGGSALTDDEALVANQMGLTPEEMLAGRSE